MIGLAKSKKVVRNISRQMFSKCHSDLRNSVIVIHNFLKGLQKIVSWTAEENIQAVMDIFVNLS